MTSLLPTPEPADPVEGQPGHFEHSNWVKAGLKALDSGVVHKDGDTMTGDLSLAGARLHLGEGRFRYDAATGSFVLDGMSGLGADRKQLILSVEDPTRVDHAATKGYVDKLGVWQPYTPATANLVGGTTAGRYCRIGNTIHYSVRYIAAQANPFSGSGIPQFRLPVDGAAVSGITYQMTSNVTFQKASGGFYPGTTLLSGAMLNCYFINPTTGALMSLSATAPFTWAAGDLIHLSGTYECAP